MSLRELLDLPDGARELAEWSPELRYLLQDLSTVDDGALWGLALGRMTLRMLKHYPDGALWQQLPRWARTLYRVIDESGVGAIARLLRDAAQVQDEAPPEELLRLLDKRSVREAAMSWADKLREEGEQRGLKTGLQRGREEGREEGRRRTRAMFLRLLRKRFGELPPAAVARVQEAEVDQLEQWIDHLLSADSLAELLGA